MSSNSSSELLLSKKNTILKVIEEEYDSIDHRSATRVPPYVMHDLERAVKNENYRACYELEKVMARCVQDKTWSMWKCQKFRDDYYRCLADHNRAHRARLLSEARWKYALGVYGGEVDGRRKFVRQVWEEYFPGKELTHEWLNE